MRELIVNDVSGLYIAAFSSYTAIFIFGLLMFPW
jgi:hypothetical protein